MADVPEAESVFLMAPTVESMGKVAGVLLRKSKQKDFDSLPQPEQGAIEEDVKYFFNEVTHTILGWVAAGHIEHLEAMIPALELARHEESDEAYFLGDAPLNRGISARLEMLVYTIRVLLNMDGPAKYLGQLAGKRREAWRDLLVRLYDRGASVRARDARELVPAFAENTRSNAAYNALEKMTEMGLLERLEQAGKKSVEYSLTWPGRAVAKTLRDLHGGESDSEAPLRFGDFDEYLESLWTQEEDASPPSATPPFAEDPVDAVSPGLIKR